ncbi:MAG: GldG family protein [Sedimentisphaerales bacterium]|nr:GldG family protein [Sedimentisphaerales bacterium]
MNKTLRIIAGVVFVLIITFSLIHICQNLGRSWKVDITEQKIYTLSDGTKTILGKLNKPVRMKLYYAKTAAMKGPDQIRYFNNYYEFVKSLLEEYVRVSGGMVELEIIDPRPYSDEEVAAIRYGLKRFPITEEEGFFFGLVVQTQFGVEKVIPVFSPSRQNFVEYDISYLIDTAMTRQKKRIGILSALEVMGDDVTPYMARMMKMQGQVPKPAWAFVEQLKQQYEVVGIPRDVNKIEDVDTLLVIHPKDFNEPTLFAIDQFVLGGGRTIVCVDPYCINDMPEQPAMQMQMRHNPSSEMDKILVKWGLEVPKDTYAGDRMLAISGRLKANDRPKKIIGFLGLDAAKSKDCFNRDNVMTSELNEVKVLFSGILRETIMNEEEAAQMNLKRIPLISTSDRGNSWKANPYELMSPDADRLMEKFTDGTKPVHIGYMVTGRFKSAFPDGIDIEVEEAGDANEPVKVTRHLDALPAASEDCAVAVFADVDFLSDMVAYVDTFFGKLVAGDNSALLMNAIEDLSGSSELISIRSRGNFKRPFEVVDEIEAKAEEETAVEEAKINAEIKGFESELQSILGSAKKGEEEIIGSSIVQKKKELELKILEARKQLKQIRKVRLERIEKLGNKLRNFNMLAAPAVILLIVIILGIQRSAKKRHYISHASDS